MVGSISSESRRPFRGGSFSGTLGKLSIGPYIDITTGISSSPVCDRDLSPAVFTSSPLPTVTPARLHYLWQRVRRLVLVHLRHSASAAALTPLRSLSSGPRGSPLSSLSASGFAAIQEDEEAGLETSGSQVALNLALPQSRAAGGGRSMHARTSFYEVSSEGLALEMSIERQAHAV